MRLADQMGNQFDPKQESVKHLVQNCSYAKLINVPSMLDIGGTIADPTDESLVLSMIDHGTLNAISNFTKKVNLGSDLTLKEAEEAAFGQ